MLTQVQGLYVWGSMLYWLCPHPKWEYANLDMLSLKAVGLLLCLNLSQV